MPRRRSRRSRRPAARATAPAVSAVELLEPRDVPAGIPAQLYPPAYIDPIDERQASSPTAATFFLDLFDYDDVAYGGTGTAGTYTLNVSAAAVNGAAPDLAVDLDAALAAGLTASDDGASVSLSGGYDALAGFLSSYGFTVTPADYFSGDVELAGRVTDGDGNVTEETFGFSVYPVAGTSAATVQSPVVVTFNADLGEATYDPGTGTYTPTEPKLVKLDVTVTPPADTDGSEAVYVRLTGVPAEIVLVDGGGTEYDPTTYSDGDGNWEIPAALLNDLYARVGATGTFQIGVSVRVEDYATLNYVQDEQGGFFSPPVDATDATTTPAGTLVIDARGVTPSEAPPVVDGPGYVGVIAEGDGVTFADFGSGTTFNLRVYDDPDEGNGRAGPYALTVTATDDNPGDGRDPTFSYNAAAAAGFGVTAAANPDGSVTFTGGYTGLNQFLAQYGFAVFPNSLYSGNVLVTATAVDGDGVASASAYTLLFGVRPVADTPVVTGGAVPLAFDESAGEATFDPGTGTYSPTGPKTVKLAVAVENLDDVDGSELVTLAVSGLPAGSPPPLSFVNGAGDVVGTFDADTGVWTLAAGVPVADLAAFLDDLYVRVSVLGVYELTLGVTVDDSAYIFDPGPPSFAAPPEGDDGGFQTFDAPEPNAFDSEFGSAALTVNAFGFTPPSSTPELSGPGYLNPVYEGDGQTFVSFGSEAAFNLSVYDNPEAGGGQAGLYTLTLVATDSNPGDGRDPTFQFDLAGAEDLGVTVTVNPDGSVTLVGTYDFLNTYLSAYGFTVFGDPYYSGDITLSATVTDAEGLASLPYTLLYSVLPVAEAPSIDVADLDIRYLAGGSRTVKFDIRVGPLADDDGSEAVRAITLSGFGPGDVTLVNGQGVEYDPGLYYDEESGTWTFTPAEAADLYARADTPGYYYVVARVVVDDSATVTFPGFPSFQSFDAFETLDAGTPVSDTDSSGAYFSLFADEATAPVVYPADPQTTPENVPLPFEFDFETQYGSGAYFSFEVYDQDERIDDQYTAVLTAVNGVLVFDEAAAAEYGITVLNNGTASVTLIVAPGSFSEEEWLNAQSYSSYPLDRLNWYFQDYGFVFVPTAYYSGPATVTLTVTDQDGLSGSGTADVLVTPVAQQVDPSASAVVGAEDTAIGLGISLPALLDTDGSEATTVTVSGVPAGATLSAGTNLGGGVWRLTRAQLAGLRLTPPAGFTGSFTLTVTAVNTDTAGELSDTKVGQTTVTVTVVPAAAPPRLAVADAAGPEGSGIGLSIAAALTDADGSETLSVRVRGLPAGYLLSAGTFDPATGDWVLTPDQLAGLTVFAPNDVGGPVTVTVIATATELSNGSTASTVGTFTLTVANVVPVVTGTQAAAATTAGTPVTLNLGSFADPGAEGTWTVVVDWGDGTSDTFTVTAPGDLGSRTHTYTAAGDFTVTVRVFDGGGFGEATAAVAVAALPPPPPVTPQEAALLLAPIAVDDAGDGLTFFTGAGVELGGGGGFESETTDETADAGDDVSLRDQLQAIGFVPGPDDPDGGPREGGERTPLSASGSQGGAAGATPAAFAAEREKHPLPPILPLDPNGPVNGFGDSGGDSIQLIDQLYRGAAGAPAPTDAPPAPGAGGMGLFTPPPPDDARPAAAFAAAGPAADPLAAAAGPADEAGMPTWWGVAVATVAGAAWVGGRHPATLRDFLRRALFQKVTREDVR